MSGLSWAEFAKFLPIAPFFGGSIGLASSGELGWLTSASYSSVCGFGTMLISEPTYDNLFDRGLEAEWCAVSRVLLLEELALSIVHFPNQTQS